MKHHATITYRRGALAGAVVYLCLFLYCVIAHFGFSVMGVSDPELTRLAKTYLFGPAVWFEVKLLAICLAIGAAAGLWAATSLRGLEALTRRRHSRRVSILIIIAAVLTLHLLIMGRGIVLYPQLYAEFFYERGGLWQWLQTILTDRIGPTPFTAGIVILAGTGAALWTLMVATNVRRGQLPRVRAKRLLAALAVPAIVITAAILATRPPRLQNRGPNLILIGADSVRPDRLSHSGYNRDTSPALDRLAAAGVRFENAYVQLPRTFPSWVSMLTGQYPFQHGITTMFPAVAARQKPFPALPRIARAAGYRTAVVADYAGDIFPRIDLGFETVDAPGFSFDTLAKIRGLEIHTHLLPYLANPYGRELVPVLKEFAGLGNPAFVERGVKQQLKRLRGEDRFLLTVFFSCTHFPYSPPWPYYRRYTDINYRGLSKYNKLNRINVDEEVTPEDVRQINALFDGAIRVTDDAVAGIIAALEHYGLADNTVVVFLSDHGENLYERGAMMGHGDHLRHPYSLKQPLIIYDPRRPGNGRVVRRTVRSIDLFPTLLELLDLPAPANVNQDMPPGFAATSLVPCFAHGDDLPDLPAYAETGLWFVHDGPGFFQRERLPYPDVTGICWFEEYYHREIVLREEWAGFTEVAKDRMLIDNGWKIIYKPLPGGVEWELYDLNADPDELHDLAGERPDELERMKTKLYGFLKSRPGWFIVGGYFVPVTGDLP